MKRIVTDHGMVIEGNPEEVPLHESLAALADWVDYEAEVVDAAAAEIDDAEVAALAEAQADEMEDAAEALDDAADAARDTAAEVFNETGIPQDEQPAEVVAGNSGPGVHANVSSIETSAMGNPGKFEGEDEAVEELYGESPDQEAGDSEGPGWYGLYRESNPADGGWILTEDSQGFVSGAFYGTAAELDAEWAEVEKYTSAFYGNPGGADVPSGFRFPRSNTVATAAARPSPVPPADAPVPVAAQKTGSPAPDIAPEPDHWYKRTLVRKG